MARITTVQAAHTYGVLDPHMIERRDTKFVGGSLSDGENIILLPQGGYTDRGGTTDISGVRRRLSPLTLTAGMLTLPNGGTAADMLDPATTVTTSAASGSRFVVVEIQLAAAQPVVAIDLSRIRIDETGAAGALIVEWHNGSSWQPFGAPALLTTTARSRRIAAGPPGHAGHNATRFRVAINASGSASGAVSIREVTLRTEAELTDAIIRRYSRDQNNNYRLIITHGNVDVFEGVSWRAAIALPITAPRLRAMKLEARFDQILAWHQDMRPQRIERLGSGTEWSCDSIVFENVPRVDYGEVYTNGVTEVQEIIPLGVATGDSFQLTLEGNTTTGIVQDANTTVTAASIKAALEALPGVSPGLTVTVAATASLKWVVEFTGEGNENRDWLQMSGEALNMSGFVRVRTVTEGKAGGEPIMSDVRGWPAIGRFAQQRLIMAGLKSRPNEMLASVTGAPFDINTEIGIATAAFSYEIDGLEDNEIRDIVVARTLIFLGSEQTAYLRAEILSAEEVPRFGRSDSPGVANGVGAVSSDNALFYIQEGRHTLRLLNYSELEQNYVSENVSVLSAHLIRQPIDMVRRRSTGSVDSDLIVMVNGDGTVTALTMMRTQEVSGFAPWRMDGDVLSVTVDDDNVLWFLVRHGNQIRQERHEPELLLDAAREYAGAATTTITGLARLEGREVWCVAADQIFGPFTVSGGQIQLDEPVTAARVGTWTPPFATDPPVSIEEETRARQARLKRVSRAVISVLETTSLAIATNGGPPIDLPLRSNEETELDVGPLARPVTGQIEAEGMHGFTRDGRLTVTQVRPGEMTVRSVTKDVAA